MSTTKFKISGTVVQGESTETGMEGGTIVLQKGTTISGATITVKNLNTGAVLGTTTSDSNGDFSIEVAAVSNSVTAKKNGTTYATDNLTEEALGPDVIGSETIPA
jgi:carboxypeptidase family protein